MKHRTHVRRRMKQVARKSVVADLFPVFVALAVALFVVIRGAEGPATVRFHSVAGDGGCASSSLLERANSRRAERVLARTAAERKSLKEEATDVCREDRAGAACRRARRAVERADEALRSARGELWAARVVACM